MASTYGQLMHDASHKSSVCLLNQSIPAILLELLLKVMPAFAPPGRTLSFAATDRNRLNGTIHVVRNKKPKMYSKVCHESRQK